MKALTFYHEAVKACMEQQYFAIARLHETERELPAVSHDCYEFTLHTDNKTYCIDADDLFIIKHRDQIIQSEFPLLSGRVIILVHPAFLENLSTSKTDLSYCFSYRPEQFLQRLPLSAGQKRRLIYYISRLTSVSGFGSDLTERCIFTELILYITRLCRDREFEENSMTDRIYNTKIAEITSYIHKNIGSPLSIDHIASHFYLSGPYLCRLFKKCMGTTINHYITEQRIILARTWLEDGYGVNEVAGMCGFNDYSNFFKAFKKYVGVSPKKYSQQA